MTPRVRDELFAELFRQMQPALIGLGAGSGVLVLAALMWGQGRPATVPWAVAHLAVIGIWVVADLRYRRRPEPARSLSQWGRWATVFATASGAMWGLGAVLFFDPNDLVNTALLVTFFAGISVVCVAAFSASYRMFVAVTVTASGPLCVMSLTSGSRPFVLIGIGQLAYFGLILIASYRHHQSLRDAAELRFHNEDLAARLRFFLASTSHDLVQPLHAQSLFVELLEARVQDPEQRALLARIQASGRALKALLDALLELSRIDAHALKVQPSHFALAGLFEELDLEMFEGAQRKGLTLDVRPTAAIVHTDRDLLGRVLRNLLSNAVRYTEAGSVTLEARDVGGGRVAVHVADTGLGISPAEQQQVFEAFFQGQSAQRERGLGLGLSIVRGLCEALQAPLRLTSQPAREQGTEFVVELAAGDPAQVRPQVLAARPMTTPLTGRRVLVIDDEEQIRNGTAALLTSWDCAPVCASSLGEAIVLASQGRVDGVVCDYRLGGGVSGIDALAALEKHVGAKLPAVFVTAETSPDRLSELRASGRSLLFKPVQPGKLRAALSALLT